MNKIRRTWQIMEAHTHIGLAANGNGGERSLAHTDKTHMLLLRLRLRLHLFPQSYSYSWQLKYPNLLCSRSYLRCSSYTIGCLKWDPNAENTRSQRLGFSFGRNNNDDQYEDDDEEEDNDDIDAGSWGSKKKKKREMKSKRQWWSNELEQEEVMDYESSGILDQVIDNIGIFKVFKSFGWMLPAVILSILLANGPKAFLMALAVSLGQSALFLAFEKLMGKEKHKPKRKARKRRKPSASTVNNFETEEEGEESQETRKRQMGYQSWMGSNNGSTNYGGQEAPDFGGWDDLDSMGSMRKASQMAGESRRTRVEKGKLSKRGRKSSTPLLLRLLIAVFPFLGSWTKMLL